MRGDGTELKCPHIAESKLIEASRSARRRNEFALGRHAAHRALQQLGVDAAPAVLRGSLGEPLWPEGVVGSISHAAGAAAAFVARTTRCTGMGIDLEHRYRPLREGVIDYICRPVEKEWVMHGCACTSWQERLLLLFSAKESFFKGVFTTVGRRFGFHEVELHFEADRHYFAGTTCSALAATLPLHFPFEIGAQLGNELVLTTFLYQARAER